jgi:Uma2 family endonuclease
MATATVDIRRWTREEYERLVEQGFFDPEERIELVDGVILEMSPQSRRHARGVLRVQSALTSLFSKGFHIQSQMPMALGPDSEPEPDLAVVPGSSEDYPDDHPSSAVLVVEVADSSLLRDRNKARLYARTGIPEYWIMNLLDGCLEVYREPQEGVFTSRTVLHPGDCVAPLSRPEATIPVASLLPRK